VLACDEQIATKSDHRGTRVVEYCAVQICLKRGEPLRGRKKQAGDFAPACF
jgi:hypothetical protein